MLLTVTSGAAASIESSPGRVLAYPEVLRCVLCVLVVLGHCDNAFMGFAIAGVVGFLSMSIGFALLEQEKPKLVRRASTTIRLWLVWSAIYVALLMMKDILTGKPLGSFFEPWMLAMGPSMHLWFLPALAISLLLLGVLSGQRSKLWFAIACAFAATSAWIARDALSADALPPPLGHAVLTAFLVSLAALSSRLIPPRIPKAWASLAWICALIGIGCTQLRISEFASYAILVPATVGLCRIEQPRPPSWLIACSSLTAGVYLVHPAFIAALQPLGLDLVVRASATLVLSAVVVGTARRGPLRPLFP
jgi:hypothetical protein